MFVVYVTYAGKKTLKIGSASGKILSEHPKCVRDVYWYCAIAVTFLALPEVLITKHTSQLV